MRPDLHAIGAMKRHPWQLHQPAPHGQRRWGQRKHGRRLNDQVHAMFLVDLVIDRPAPLPPGPSPLILSDGPIPQRLLERSAPRLVDDQIFACRPKRDPGVV